ncbi:MAG TPA: hypothetical protein VHH09_02195 [Acidimicrobiales bacterium]|nr:hypothetical protein [Acidimicrobiales bacterium]
MGQARARWVARRTLHRRIGPAVGETEGVPTYSIEGAKVALPPSAHHFRRVVACARCGREVMDRSRPVYRRRDLHLEIQLMCEECADIAVHPGHPGDAGDPGDEDRDRPPDARPSSPP